MHRGMMDIPASLVGWDSGTPRGGVGTLEGPQGGPFSVKAQFAGATVLLTGCTGYIGGLVLESMLRTTDVARVYVLLRPKKATPAQERCDKLLQGPTFHMIREKPELLAKVAAVAGDLSEPGLGLSAADREALAANVDIVIHSAADIRLEAPIQVRRRGGGGAVGCGGIAAAERARLRVGRRRPGASRVPRRRRPHSRRSLLPPPPPRRRRCAPTTSGRSVCWRSRCSCAGEERRQRAGRTAMAAAAAAAARPQPSVAPPRPHPPLTPLPAQLPPPPRPGCAPWSTSARPMSTSTTPLTRPSTSASTRS
jgi:hypothetical protein